MPKVPRHQMYLRSIGTVPARGAEDVAAALASVGATAHLHPLLGREAELVEISVTGRDEAAARTVIALEAGRIAGLELEPDDATDVDWT